MSEDDGPDPRNVFVVYGRNDELRRAMFDFLRAIGLNPLEWSMAVELTETGAPYVGEVLDAAFARAKAVVVLLTPDEVAYLQPAYENHPGDPETQPMAQARPNVLFEAGMAMGRHPRHTILVEVGEMRPFTDVAGRHAVRMTNAIDRRQELANRLRTAGCSVSMTGRDWHEAGDFTAPAPPGVGLPLGRRVPSTRAARALNFDASYHDQGSDRAGRLQIINRGTDTAYDVKVEIPEGASLSFPDRMPDIPKIPGNGKSVSLTVWNQGRHLGDPELATAFDLTVKARTESGEEFITQQVFVDTNG
jgi:hypothetical protein